MWVLPLDIYICLHEYNSVGQSVGIPITAPVEPSKFVQGWLIIALHIIGFKR